MKPKKFTFKIHKPTGRYRSFDVEYADIKLSKKVCGAINEKKYSSEYSISFMIVDGEDWEWKTLKKRFGSMNEAKEFLNENYEIIQKEYNLFLQEN